MILAIGSRRDRVFPDLLEGLSQASIEHAVIDEDAAHEYQIVRDGPGWQVTGGACTGNRPVTGVFVRHAVPRTVVPRQIDELLGFQSAINLMLEDAACLVINHPKFAFSNWSKPYQLGLLARHGFDIPATLVTNEPGAAREFVSKHGRVIVKGVSNVTTLAQVIRDDASTSDELERVRHCPVQLQEYVEGDDLRVHVVGHEVFVTRIVSRDPDYRRSALVDDAHVELVPGTLPADLTERCFRVTSQLGLIVSGIDFKVGPNGRLVVLELNPFPQFTFYERRSGQSITRAVLGCLTRARENDITIHA